MLADDLLRTSQLTGQFAVAAVLQDVSAHRLALPDRQTLKQVECSLTLPGKLLDASEIAIVERQRRNAFLRSASRATRLKWQDLLTQPPSGPHRPEPTVRNPGGGNAGGNDGA